MQVLCEKHIALKRFLEAVANLQKHGVEIQPYTLAQAIKNELRYDLATNTLTIIK